MTGESEATRAVAMAVVIGAIGFSILKWTDLKDWDVFVSPGFWTGSLIGGTVFGLGMSLSGGCGTSSLWRAGEGQINLLVFTGRICLERFAVQRLAGSEWLVAENRGTGFSAGLHELEYGTGSGCANYGIVVYHCGLERCS